MKRNWVITTFNFVVEKFISGGAFPKQYQGKKEGYYPFAKVADISKLYRQGYKDIESATNFITQAEQKELKTPIFPINTIVFPKIGEALKNNYRLITNKPMLFDNNVMGIVTNPNKAVVKYIYYFLLAQDFGKLSVATTIPSVRSADIGNLQIPVPPLAEQKRIVKKIEELFGVIDEQVKRLEATQEALVSYRQSVLTDCLRKAAGVSTTLGKTVKPRRERVTFNGTNGNMIFIGMDCIESNALKPHKTDLLRNTKSTCFIFHKDDVLYGRMRSYLNKVFKAETNGAASAEFIVFPPTKDILPDYLKYLLHQQDFVSFATRNASGDRPRVKFEEDLAPFPFTLPSLPEQKAIVKKIENAFAFADKAQAAITGALEQAKQLKQSILKRAFEGKLVPQDPNDKPVDLTQLKKDKHK